MKVWVSPRYDLASVFTRSEQLAERHSATLGTRSLDILHVAAALEIEAGDFVTRDERLARLASAVGLRVVALGRRGRRRWPEPTPRR